MLTSSLDLLKYGTMSQIGQGDWKVNKTIVSYVLDAISTEN